MSDIHIIVLKLQHLVDLHKYIYIYIYIYVYIFIYLFISSGNDWPGGTFLIPHSITVDERRGQVHVADRENGRLQSFDLQGNLLSVWNNEELGPKLYAVTYNNATGKLLFCICYYMHTILNIKGVGGCKLIVVEKNSSALQAACCAEQQMFCICVTAVFTVICVTLHCVT